MSVFTLNQPSKNDAFAIHQLIAQCPPLDINSVYTYLLLAEHHAATCVLARQEGGQTVGFVSAYIHPGQADTLFIWQVAVSKDSRGCGMGKHMLQHLLQSSSLSAIRYLETTVAPNNVASRHMFTGMAKWLDADISESALFGRHLFGPGDHEDERLIRMGPFDASANHALT